MLRDAAGEEVGPLREGERLKLEPPVLWNAEEPYLTAWTCSEDECFSQDVGFRKLEIKGDVFYLNGKISS